MSNKEAILANIRRNIRSTYDLPNTNDIHAIHYNDKLSQFIEISKQVGGKALVTAPGDDINDTIRTLYPEAVRIASNVPGINIANVFPDEMDDPHKLNGVDLAVVRGEIGVAENGCIWIPQNVTHRVLYFISEYLVILLDKNNIVHNMHEAYGQIKAENRGFGVFISGPSKTADIEQALVVGAHGARGVTVILV